MGCDDVRRALAGRMHAAHVWVVEGISVAETVELAGGHGVCYEPLGGIPISARDARDFAREALGGRALLIADDSQATFAISAPLLRGADLCLEPLGCLPEGAGAGLMAVGVARGRRVPEALLARLEASEASSARSEALLAALDGFEHAVRSECGAACAVASYLSCHPKVSLVRYPGLRQDPSHEAAARALHHGFGRLVDFATTAVGLSPLESDAASLRRVGTAGEGAQAQALWRLECRSADAKAIALALERALA